MTGSIFITGNADKYDITEIRRRMYGESVLVSEVRDDEVLDRIVRVFGRFASSVCDPAMAGKSSSIKIWY